MALTPWVNVGVASGTVNGTYTASNNYSKSYAYDEAQYTQTDPVNLTIAAAGNSSVAITAFTAKQLKSITVTPTTAPTAGDFLYLTQYTVYPVVYGTATGTTILGVGLSGNGTLLGTGINKVTFNILNNYGSAVGGASGTQFIGLGTQAVYNPTYAQISGGTCTVIVTGPGGTNTQGGYVFPTGPNGGISLNAGDVLVIGKGTDTVGVYQLELECVFTPGGYVTK